jgi:hypothetical protein
MEARKSHHWMALPKKKKLLFPRAKARERGLDAAECLIGQPARA